MLIKKLKKWYNNDYIFWYGMCGAGMVSQCRYIYVIKK